MASGFSPATFTLKNSAQYTVGATSYSNDTFDHWLDTGSSVNPRPTSISSNTQITAVYRDTGLTLSPTSGPTGTTVSVTGIAFSNNHQVTLTWDGTTSLGTVTTDSTGGFSTTFQVPTAPNGSHTVQATDGAGNIHSAPFTVGP